MPDELTCGFCSENLETFTLSQRGDHYEAHFLGSGCGNIADGVRVESSRQNVPQSTGKKGKNRFNPSIREPWKNLVKRIENDVFWYPSLGILPPRNYTPGLIPILKQSLNILCTNGKVARAVLCHEKVVHISKELWDAPWGCGYRSFMMLCTGLVEQEHQPLYFSLLDISPSPSVRNLQIWIQSAWDAGYDIIGRKELRSKIIGTSKWIGTAEIYIALSHRGIPAELVDFNEFHDKESCVANVIQWMIQYFKHEGPERAKYTSINDVLGKTSPIFSTQLMPVILQHRGHSRVIIGYQQDVDGTVSLLTFDTGRILPFALRSLGRSTCRALNTDDNRTREVSIEAPITETEVNEGQTVNSHKRPITFTDLLTPSEKELVRDPLFLPEENKQSGKKTKFISHLKIAKKDKQCRGAGREPDAHQVQKALKLTPHQLASNTEYQVLYIPLRAPLSEDEKLDRKVVCARRITGNSPPSTGFERTN